MSKLWMSIIAQTIAGILAFLQLQAWVAWPKIQFFKSLTWLYLTSIVIAPLFFYSTKWSYEHFGAFWNMRLAGFGISTIIFGIMAWQFIGEMPTIKTLICILLAIAIILIQITNL